GVMKKENRFSKDRFNSLKRDTLEIFRVYGPLNPPAWARLAKFSPIRASYSYLLRLHRFGLLNRTSNPYGLVLCFLYRGFACLAGNVYAIRTVPNCQRADQRILPVPSESQIRSNEAVGKRLLKVEEAARYLGLEVDTVYKKARLRELPSVKVGRALRFDVEA